MGREVRKVIANWQHPKDEYEQRFKPLLNRDYKQEAADFLNLANEKGLQEAIDYYGCAPDESDYMPAWSNEEKTHLMMYENTSEGTPISPAFETPEELAKWFVENNASAFASQTASYEAWLKLANGGYAVSMVITPSTGLISGVEALLLNGK